MDLSTHWLGRFATGRKGSISPRDWTAAYSTAFDIPEGELFGAGEPKRRDILEISVSAIDTPTYPPHQGSVAPELVMYFLEQLPGHYKADM